MVAPFRIVIPSRFASSRLPGKPLRKLAGKTMIQRVWEQAVHAGAEEVWVATDDDRIAAVVSQFGGQVCMTSKAHSSGTDRLAEVARNQGFPGDSIIVNLQGDEPGIPPNLLTQVASSLAARPDVGIATVATPIRSSVELFDPNAVKVVIDEHGTAHYFSRAPIPWVRDAFSAGPPAELPKDVLFLRHIGLYAYRTDTLLAVASAAPAVNEQAESLEQLRALSMGLSIHVSVIPEAPAHGIDTEADLERAQAYFAGAA